MKYCTISLALLLILIGTTSLTQVFTDKFNYQGRLTDSFGVPAPAGPYSMTFLIYDQAVGGSPLWYETRAVDVGNDGLFSLNLGRFSALSPDIFSNSTDSTSRWLEIVVGATDTISPRTLLASVPFAQVASRVVGDIITDEDSTTFRQLIVGLAGIQMYGPGRFLDTLSGPFSEFDTMDYRYTCSYDTTGDTQVVFLGGTFGDASKAPSGVSAYSDMLLIDFVIPDTICRLESSVSAEGAITSYTHDNQKLSLEAGRLSFTDAIDLGCFIENLPVDHDDSVQAYFLGRVGIGTSTPSGKLHVSDDDTSASIIGHSAGSGAGLKAVNNSTGPGIVGMAYSGDLLQLYTLDSIDLRFQVDNSGNLCLDGTISESGGCDLAENMAVLGDINDYEPGDVLVLSKDRVGFLEMTDEAYSKRVVGIFSSQPGFHLGANAFNHTASQVPVALSGIVDCKVTSENGPIEIGDMLVTSSTPGCAMKATDSETSFGAVIGKAMEALPEGRGRIKVLVVLR